MALNTVKSWTVVAAIAGLGIPLASALPASAATTAAVAPASAAHGLCTNGAHWNLQAKPDGARIEWEFEVDTNRAGQVWAVRVTDNGSALFAGNRTTTAPSGSFTVRGRSANRPGNDVIRATATRGTAVCRGTVTV